MSIAWPDDAFASPELAAFPVVREALEACAEERRRLELAIAAAQARVEAARSARAALPALSQLLSDAHDALATMEVVYRTAAARVLLEADAEARAAVGVMATRS